MSCLNCLFESSNYFTNLKGSVKHRYQEKTFNLFSFDPFNSQSCAECNWQCDIMNHNLPNLTLINIYKYLVLDKSFYTHNQFNAFKSLESYDRFQCGWVKDVKWILTDEYTIFTCKVWHSMKINEKNLEVWISLNKVEFAVLSGHCTCVAGQSECCTHIGALLFYINFFTSVEETSVTDKLAYWVDPGSNSKNKLPASRSSDINFQKLRLQKRKFEPHLNIDVPVSKISHPITNYNDLVTMFHESKSIIPNAATMRVVGPFQDEINRARCNYQHSSEIEECHSTSIFSTHNKNDTNLGIAFNAWNQGILDEISVLMLRSSCPSDVLQFYEKFIEVNVDKAMEIFACTTGQNNATWKFQRTTATASQLLQMVGPCRNGILIYPPNSFHRQM